MNYLIRQEAQAQCHQFAACQMKIGHRADLLWQRQAGQRLESHWAVASSPQSRSSRARVLIALNYPSSCAPWAQRRLLLVRSAS